MPTVQAAANNRPSWFPGSKFPAHLDGTMVGDHGFDPLNLGVDPAKLKWCAAHVYARMSAVPLTITTSTTSTITPQGLLPPSPSPVTLAWPHSLHEMPLQ